MRGIGRKEPETNLVGLAFDLFIGEVHPAISSIGTNASFGLRPESRYSSRTDPVLLSSQHIVEPVYRFERVLRDNDISLYGNCSMSAELVHLQ
jgi:hypothetical protein